MPSATTGLDVEGKCVTADNKGTPPPTKGRESDPQPTRPNNNDNIHVFPSLNTLLLTQVGLGSKMKLFQSSYKPS